MNLRLGMNVQKETGFLGGGWQMVQGDPFLFKVMMDMKVEETLREAETRRLLRQASIDRHGWLFRQGCWLLCQAGRLLVILGRRLQEYGTSQSVSLETAKVSGHG